MTLALPRLAPVLGLAVLLAATGCVPQSTLPADCDASRVERTATLTATGLRPNAIDVCKGQAVTLTIDAQAAGELHLHGYLDQVPERQVAVGETVKLDFTASRAGQFTMELHNGEDEVELAILTVHER